MSQPQYCVGALVSLSPEGDEHFEKVRGLRCIQQLAFRIEEVLPDGRIVLVKANELPKSKKARTVPLGYIQPYKGK